VTPDEVLTVLNFMDQAPSHTPATLRQGAVLVRYAQAGTPAASLIRRDAELLLALTPHGLIGPELLELDLGGRRARHAFSLQRLPDSRAVHGHEGDGEAVWRQLGAYLRQLHRLPVLALGEVQPSPDALELLEGLYGQGVITAHDRGWLTNWIRTMQREAGPPQPATLHGALRPDNLLLTPDRQTFLGLVDWSMAHPGEAAWDHVHLPLEASAVISEADPEQTAALLLAFVTRLLLDLQEAARGGRALASATSRLLALFQFNINDRRA
jgi:hypothetical protein